MNIYFITTLILSADRLPLFERMIRSVSDANLGQNSIRMCIYALLQQCPISTREELKSRFPPILSLFAIDGKTSSPGARNELLTKLFATENVKDTDIVAFPDDDCWYPADFLRFIADIFDTNQNVDLLICRYSNAPRRASDAPAPSIASVRDVVRNASANTIFVRARAAKSVGLFDESLGLGTQYSGGEDVDYALRAFETSRRSLFCDAPLIGHRDKRPELRAFYYDGGMIVLRRHSRSSAAHFVQYVRKFMIGAFLCMRGELRVSTFLNCSFGPLPPKPRSLAI